jgi:predicted NAD-dependent protein-ADP-ribosyltransferase YbiA (DUF1768 family)
MSIRIYNPEELPFGLLSNNFEYKMTIDDEEWRNITQYIYTNLIPKENEYFRRIIKSLNYDQIPSKYSEFETIIKDNYIKDLLKMALEKRFQEPHMKEYLLNTGNSRMFYINEQNLFFGTSKKLIPELKKNVFIESKNILGQVFEEIRAKFQEHFIDTRMFEQYVKYFMIGDIVVNKLKTTIDFLKFLPEGDMNMINEFIAREYEGGMEEARNNINFDTYKNKINEDELLKQVLIISQQNPKILIHYSLSNNIKKCIGKYQEDVSKIVFEKYLSNFEQQKSLSRNDIKNELKYINMKYLEEILFNIYTANKFPSFLSQQIQDAINEINLYLPSEQEIRTFENFNINLFFKEDDEIRLQLRMVDKTMDDEDFLFTDNDSYLSIFATENIRIDGEEFINVDQYLQKQIAGNEMFNQEIRIEKIKYLCNIALNKKFKFVSMDLNSNATMERANIDFHHILYLAKERKLNIIQLDEIELVSIVTSEYLNYHMDNSLNADIIRNAYNDMSLQVLINDDVFISKFVQIFIKNICNLISNMYYLIKNKYNSDFDVSVDFVKSIYEKMYLKGNELNEDDDELLFINENYSSQINDDLRNLKCDDDVKNQVWKFIVNDLKRLWKTVKEDENKLFEMKNIIANIQLDLSANLVNEYMIVDNVFENSIIHTIIYLFEEINNISKEYLDFRYIFDDGESEIKRDIFDIYDDELTILQIYRQDVKTIKDFINKLNSVNLKNYEDDEVKDEEIVPPNPEVVESLTARIPSSIKFNKEPKGNEKLLIDAAERGLVNKFEYLLKSIKKGYDIKFKKSGLLNIRNKILDEVIIAYDKKKVITQYDIDNVYGIILNLNMNRGLPKKQRARNPSSEDEMISFDNLNAVDEDLEREFGSLEEETKKMEMMEYEKLYRQENNKDESNDKFQKMFGGIEKAYQIEDRKDNDDNDEYQKMFEMNTYNDDEEGDEEYDDGGMDNTNFEYDRIKLLLKGYLSENNVSPFIKADDVTRLLYFIKTNSKSQLITLNRCNFFKKSKKRKQPLLQKQKQKNVAEKKKEILSINTCNDISKSVINVNGIIGGSTASETWILDLNKNNNQKVFCKLFINTDSSSFDLNKIKFNVEDTRTNFYLSSKSLSYEMRIYKEIIGPLKNLKVCKHFLPLISTSSACSYENILDILKNNVVDSYKKTKMEDDVVNYVLQRNINNSIINMNKKLTINQVNPNENEYNQNQDLIQTMQYSLLLTKLFDLNNGFTLTYFLTNYFQNSDIVLQVLFQICVVCYTMSLSKMTHNDLHGDNIFIKKLKQMETFVYYINNNRYEIKTFFKVYIFDFNFSYVEKLGKNEGINDHLCDNFNVCNQFIENKDILKVLCAVYKFYPDSIKFCTQNNEYLEKIKQLYVNDSECFFRDTMGKTASAEFFSKFNDTLKILKMVYSQIRRNDSDTNKISEQKINSLFSDGGVDINNISIINREHFDDGDGSLRKEQHVNSLIEMNIGGNNSSLENRTDETENVINENHLNENEIDSEIEKVIRETLSKNLDKKENEIEKEVQENSTEETEAEAEKEVRENDTDENENEVRENNTEEKETETEKEVQENNTDEKETEENENEVRENSTEEKETEKEEEAKENSTEEKETEKEKEVQENNTDEKEKEKDAKLSQSFDFDKKKSINLIENGYVIFEGSKENKLVNFFNEQTEFIKNKPLIFGVRRYNFSHPNSYHHKEIRNIRRNIYFQLLKHFKTYYGNKYIEMLFGNLYVLKKGSHTISFEKFLPSASTDDVIFNGWINLDDSKSQIFSYKKIGMNDIYMEEVKPLNIVLYNVNRIEETELTYKDLDENMYRLYFSFHISDKNKPLYDNTSAIENLDVPIINGKKPEVYSDDDFVKWGSRLRHFSTKIEPVFINKDNSIVHKTFSSLKDGSNLNSKIKYDGYNEKDKIASYIDSLDLYPS